MENIQSSGDRWPGLGQAVFDTGTAKTCSSCRTQLVVVGVVALEIALALVGEVEEAKGIDYRKMECCKVVLDKTSLIQTDVMRNVTEPGENMYVFANGVAQPSY